MEQSAEKGQPETMQERRGMHVFNRKKYNKQSTNGHNRPQRETDMMERGEQEPRVNHNGHRVHPRIEPDGESGRSWFHPWHFLRICWRSSNKVSMYTNLLWPFTIAAIALHFYAASFKGENAEEERRPYQLWIFITAYIGMVPAANLVGFAGQELARKIPKVAGVILETTFGSIVEIILFIVLISGGPQNVSVIQAAILGSILANMLLCLGMYCSDIIGAASED
jgi:Ca2+:H+ antiporter